MRPRSPVFDLLVLSGGWEPLRSLAQDTGRSYETARTSVRRWKRAGLVETRQIELAQSGHWQGNDIKVEVRILEATQ